MNSGMLRTGKGRAVWVVGDHYTIKASGEDTGRAFALIEALVPAQSGPPPHIHRREDEAFYVLEGEFEVHVDDQRLIAGPPGSRWPKVLSTISRTSARRPQRC